MSSLPNHTYIDTYIQDGQKAVMSLKNFYETILVTDVDNRDHIIRIPIDDFFSKYHDQLETAVQWYNVPDRYFYQPKTVSLEIYDTTEMWLALLRLNHMRNVTEFNQSFIKIYNPEEIKDLIGIIFKREGKIT